jgi:hypothetical protein
MSKKQNCSLTSKHLKNFKRTKMELEVEEKEYKNEELNEKIGMN